MSVWHLIHSSSQFNLILKWVSPNLILSTDSSPTMYTLLKKGDQGEEEKVSVLQCGFPIFCQCGRVVDIVKKSNAFLSIRYSSTVSTGKRKQQQQQAMKIKTVVGSENCFKLVSWCLSWYSRWIGPCSPVMNLHNKRLKRLIVNSSSRT